MDNNKHPAQKDDSMARQRRKNLMVNKKSRVHFKKANASSSTSIAHSTRQVLTPITNNPLFIASQREFQNIQNQCNFSTQSETHSQQSAPLNQSHFIKEASKDPKLLLHKNKIPTVNLGGPSILHKPLFKHQVASHSLLDDNHTHSTKSQPSNLSPTTNIFIPGFGSQSFTTSTETQHNQGIDTKLSSKSTKISPIFQSQTIPILKHTNQNNHTPSNSCSTPNIFIPGFGSQSFPIPKKTEEDQATASHLQDKSKQCHIDLSSQSKKSASWTQPNSLHKTNPEPIKRYHTRGVNLYNKFTATIDKGQSSSSHSPSASKSKSQYSHIFGNHVIEDESSDSDSENNNDSDTQHYSDENGTDDENSSIDNEEDEDGTLLLILFCVQFECIHHFNRDS
jgi:hypothetical protein